jgi:voltage-gated potassium channel
MGDDRGDGSRLAAFEAATRRPMVVVSLAVIPLYVAQALAEGASPAVTRSLDLTRVAIQVAMAVDVGIRTWLAPRRWAFLAHHKLDVLAIAVPPIRALRELVGLRSVLLRPGLARFLSFAGGAFVGCALVVYAVEHDRPDATIQTVGDAFWWAMVTTTTVGYGDEVPVTDQGRLMAVLLMVLGIALLSVLTALIAAYFVGQDEKVARSSELMDRLERIEATLRVVEQHLGQPLASDPTGPAADIPRQRSP